MGRDHKIRILAAGLSGPARERRVLWLLLNTDHLDALLAGRLRRANKTVQAARVRANRAYRRLK